MIVSGYAAVFNSLSRDIDGFRERIMPGAFDDALAGDPHIEARVGHQSFWTLGSTADGSLQLHVDDFGLHYRVVVDSERVERHMHLFFRGQGSSFSFDPDQAADTWQLDGNCIVRELHRIGCVVDVGPSCSPTYAGTTVNLDSPTAARRCRLSVCND